MYESALRRQGFAMVTAHAAAAADATYQFHPATGMLQLVETTSSDTTTIHTTTTTTTNNNNNTLESPSMPRWIPVVTEQENVLVANGWSFLDVDESETMSPFDVDAANLESLYRPKWGKEKKKNEVGVVMDGQAKNKLPCLSDLGFTLDDMTSEQVKVWSISLNSNLPSKRVLLEGATDPPYEKVTHNGYCFKGNTVQQPDGIFTCAIGDLPVFATSDVTPIASSGWLSFLRPISADHVVHVEPDKESMDQRVEVVCAKSGCHLGHYFKGDGYCINASALNFWPVELQLENEPNELSFRGPYSYRSLERTMDRRKDDRALQLLRQILDSRIPKETIVLGAGCFWHVEFALRRLPGVLETKAGYAGGKRDIDAGLTHQKLVTYERVCQGDTGYAEVVQIDFDPTVLHPRVLLDCFLALHDPTKVRAHGKHAKGTGQYRSCIFLPLHSKLLPIVNDALKECSSTLRKELITEVRHMSGPMDDFFIPAEYRHQKHEERNGVAEANLSTLLSEEWLEEYGRRGPSILGSAKTLDEQVSEARLNI